MRKDNTCIWFIIIIIAMFFIFKQDRSSTPLNFDTFFGLGSSTPVI